MLTFYQSPPESSKATAAPRLGSLLESDEFQDAPEHQSIDDVLKSPPADIQSQLKRLSSMKTPKTEPRPSRGEMHPKTIHQTTTEPDSGFKLGFVDVGRKPRRSAASIQNSPSRSHENLAKTLPPSAFQFTFGTESYLSEDARKMMDQVREEAARIKSEMEAERDAQDQKDQEAEQMFNGLNASRRKIAKPKAKAGRFSDVHMAQFKKMDSIANHPSSFRARPGFARPTTQSLKRSGSKAGLDEPERPRTAGKGTPGRIPPPFSGRTGSASPFKSIVTTSDCLENTSPAKRVRRSRLDDVSASRPAEFAEPPRSSAIPRASSSLFSPTKSSLARSSTAGNLASNKPSMIPRSNRTRSVGPTPKSNRSRFSSASVSRFTSKLLEARQDAQERAAAQSAARSKPLPPIPTESASTPTRVPSVKTIPTTPTTATMTKPSTFSSRLPTFSGLRSILRSTRKVSSTDRPSTPKRQNTANAGQESSKKVDFTPSVKSRYAVKLAASSPSPAKLPQDEGATPKARSFVPYDPAAYTLEDDGDETWEDASSPVDYPTLPSEPASGPLNRTVESFMQNSRDRTRRESQEFKSIFTTLHPAKTSSPSTLTSVNTNVNKTNPTSHANKVMRSPSNPSNQASPSTIRRVRTSGVTDLVQPFEDTSVPTMPHGLPAKKRRRTSFSDETPEPKNGGKENRRQTFTLNVPGGWNDTLLDDDADDEGERRGGKRARTTKNSEIESLKKLEEVVKSPVKKSAAREQAAKSAKARKTKGQSLGGMTTSRLNALARPKSRG